MRGCLILLSLCLGLSGCVTPPKPLTAEPLRIGLELSPASLGQSLSLTQHLTIERAGTTQSLDAALDIDPKQLHLVGLVMGQRVLSLTYDGKTLQEWRHPRLPKEVSGANVLEDLELTLWPIAAIQPALPIGWSIEQQGLQRIVFFDHQKIVVIDYSGNERWAGTVTLTNVRYHYRLIIQSMANE